MNARNMLWPEVITRLCQGFPVVCDHNEFAVARELLTAGGTPMPYPTRKRHEQEEGSTT